MSIADLTTKVSVQRRRQQAGREQLIVGLLQQKGVGCEMQPFIIFFLYRGKKKNPNPDDIFLIHPMQSFVPLKNVDAK